MLLLKKYTPRVDSRLQKRVYAFQDSDSESESEAETQYEDAIEHEQPEVIQSAQEPESTSGKRSKDQLHQYFCPKSGKEISNNLSKEPTNTKATRKNGRLETQKLDLKKIEYRKKIDIVWNSIIQKYSAYDEDDQGDLINLKDFSIMEDKGHIEKLQNFQTTTIWNDINELENGGLGSEDFGRDFDPSQDPINLLNANSISRPSTPSQSDLLNSINKSRSALNSNSATPHRLKRTNILTSKTQESENDPISLLTPKPSTRPTRATSPRRRALLSSKPQVPRPSTTQSSAENPIDLTNDPISMLTPTKPSRINTRRPSPRRRSSLVYQRDEPSSPMRFMAPSSPVMPRATQERISEPTYTEISDSDEEEDEEHRQVHRNQYIPGTDEDSISLVSKVHTRSSSPSYHAHTRIESSPLRSRVESRQPSRGRTLTRPRYQNLRSSSPLDQIEEESITSLSKSQFKDPSNIRASPFKKPSDRLRAKLTPSTPLSSLRSKPQSKASTTDFSNDPICLLTPISMTRRNSRLPTRSSSPNSKRSKRNRPAELNDDPLVLLTPRSSSKRPKSGKHENRGPTSQPPPKFNLRSRPQSQPQPQPQPYMQSPYYPPQQSNPFYQMPPPPQPPHSPYMPHYQYNMQPPPSHAAHNPYSSAINTPMTSRSTTPAPYQHRQYMGKGKRYPQRQYDSYEDDSTPTTPLISTLSSNKPSESSTPMPNQMPYPHHYPYPYPPPPSSQHHQPNQMPMMMNPYMNPYMFMPYMPMMPMYPPQGPQGPHGSQGQHPLSRQQYTHNHDEMDDDYE